jgi:hypothetical protein
VVERRRIGRAALPKINNDPDDPVALGREAWRRLKGAGRTSWEDWLILGEALQVGRQEAVNKVNGKPGSKSYNQTFGHWLQIHGFDEIDKSDRSKLFFIIEDLARVQKWREGLTEAQRASWNHPSTVWRVYNCADRGWRAMKAALAVNAAKPGNVVPLAPRQAETEDDADAPSVLVAANKAEGLAEDIRNFSGDLSQTMVGAVNDAARAWEDIARDFTRRFQDQSEPDEATEGAH